VAQFLDALNQAEIESASASAIQHFVDYIPALDDMLGYLEQVEESAKAALESGSLRPYVIIKCPHGQIRYNIHLTKRNPSTLERDVMTTCKALGFASCGHCSLMVQYEEFLDRIRITGDCIRGAYIQSTIDLNLGSGKFDWQTHRDIGHRARPYDRCRFCEVKDSNEMLEVLKKTLMLSKLPSVENLPHLTEYDILLNFAISMKAMTVFSR